MSKTKKTTAGGQANSTICENIARRQLQSEFVVRGLASRDQARGTGAYVSADNVLGRLEKMLASAKSGK